MVRIVSVAALGALAFTTLGCGKDSSASPPTGAPTAAATAATAAAAKPADKAAAPAAKKKLPAKTAAKKDEGAGKKGGSGEAKPAANSHKASKETIATDKKKKVDGDDPCAALPDGAAECHGDELLVCHDKELWSIDCNGLMVAAHPDLFSAGTCYETPTITDCMGAGVAEDGVVDFCTSDLSACCDESGDCYVFH